MGVGSNTGNVEQFRVVALVISFAIFESHTVGYYDEKIGNTAILTISSAIQPKI